MAMMELDQRGTRRRPILEALQQAAQPAAPQPAAGGGTAVPRNDTAPVSSPGYQPPASPSVDVSYGGQSPVTPGGRPNPDYRGNTGVNGGATAPADAVAAPPQSDWYAPPRPAETNPGLDAGKWTSGHTSPKYAFHEVSQKYDQRTEQGRAQTLAELQQRYPSWFNGWTIAGDKLRYGGDPSQMDAKWNGYNEFDAWRGSDAGEWAPQWIPTQLNGQAYTDPGAAAQAGPASGTPANAYVMGPNGQVYGASSFQRDGNGNLILPAGFRPLSTGAPGLGGVADADTTGAPFGFGGVDPQSQYTDPYTEAMERFTKTRIEDLLAPVDDDSRDSLASLLKQRFGQLSTAGSGANPAASDLDALMQSVIGESTGQPYTATEEAQLKSNALNTIEQQRAADRKRALDDAQRRGIDPSSGPILRQLREADERAARLRTQVETEFATKAIDERRGRLGDAINYATGRRDVQERELDRGDSRMREALALAAQLSDLSSGVRGEREGRVDKAGTLISLLMELDDRAFNRSLSAQGLAPSMSSIFQNMLGLSNAQGAAQQAGRANSANSTAGMMEMLGYLFGGG